MKKLRLPDFAGVALVDILANGLAMLIIVIVLSIAARGEQEERTAEQAQQVETMMTRRFSTSLVLNSLAASPPAHLHDYVNAPQDQEHDPYLLPILELHRGFVREFYTGAIWSREELLREPNAMDAWLAGFDDKRKKRLRMDVYGIAQYYLVTSILRDHGMRARHWHFVGGRGLPVGDARRCPPGVASKDCTGKFGDAEQPDPVLPELAMGIGDARGETWPPRGFHEEGEGTLGNTMRGPFPGGASLGGIGNGGGLPGQGWMPGDGSFPNARPWGGGKTRGLLGARAGMGAGGQSDSQARFRRSSPDSQRREQSGPAGGGGDDDLSAEEVLALLLKFTNQFETSLNGNEGGGQSGMPVRFRLSTPESLRQESPLDLGDSTLSGEEVLAVLLDFTGALQATLDAGASPSRMLANFRTHIRTGFTSPPALDEGPMRDLVDRLKMEIERPDPAGDEERLAVTSLAFKARAATALVVEANQRLRRVAVGRAPDDDAPPLPETARPVLRLNAHPDVWQGLSLPLERNAILLLPPDQQRPEQSRWRAVAYVAPGFDDFIIGFVYAAVDTDGRLVVQAEDNRVRLDGRPLLTPYREAAFGARGWLVALYAGLVLCLLGFLLLARRMTAERHA